jgi:hypothetical protein
LLVAFILLALHFAAAFFSQIFRPSLSGLFRFAVFPPALIGAASLIESVLVVASFAIIPKVSAFVVAIASVALEVAFALAVV